MESGCMSGQPFFATMTGSITTLLRFVFRELARDGFHADGLRQHTHFDRVRADILKYGVNLFFNHFRRNILRADHTRRIFRDDGNNHAHAVNAVRGEGFEVGLNTRAAAAVGTGNCQILFSCFITFLLRIKKDAC